jgi:hypothetical protein
MGLHVAATAATVDATAITRIPGVLGRIGRIQRLALRNYSLCAPREREHDKNRSEPATPVRCSQRWQSGASGGSAACPRTLAPVFRLQFGLPFVCPDCLARLDRFVHLELRSRCGRAILPRPTDIGKVEPQVLLNHPYDDELKQLVGAFASLVKPMIETVDLRGLKKRFLGKHRIFVDRFYKRLSNEFGTSETARKIIERLQKNRNTMFTFLDFDDVPWNNNNAEHAIKAFASLRRVFEGTTTEKGLREFLILLSLCETCKYRGVDFLDFLRSGSKDVNGFAISQLRRQVRRAH